MNHSPVIGLVCATPLPGLTGLYRPSVASPLVDGRCSYTQTPVVRPPSPRREARSGVVLRGLDRRPEPMRTTRGGLDLRPGTKP